MAYSGHSTLAADCACPASARSERPTAHLVCSAETTTMHAGIHAYMCACVHACVCVHVCVHVCACIRACMVRVCARAGVCGIVKTPKPQP